MGYFERRSIRDRGCVICNGGLRGRGMRDCKIFGIFEMRILGLGYNVGVWRFVVVSFRGGWNRVRIRGR